MSCYMIKWLCFNLENNFNDWSEESCCLYKNEKLGITIFTTEQRFCIISPVEINFGYFERRKLKKSINHSKRCKVEILITKGENK